MRKSTQPSPALTHWLAEKPDDQPFSGLAGVTVVKDGLGHGGETASPLDVDLGPGPGCDVSGDRQK